ncbi:MAG: tetratricopeptide repeat protein [Candidatus Solibacter usitatus]|nr:tetratricopeptide repeat protein [Candidatus Solibacter usitatus]
MGDAVRVLILSLALVLPAGASDLERAQRLFDRTDYRAAIDVLSASGEPKNGPAWQLAGRSWYQLGDFKKAIDSFEKAIEAEPANSCYHNWMGRAWGRRAEIANPLSAPGYASKARGYFEKAVALNPKDQEAASDLLSYYLDAPRFLGGGLDKAAALAERMKADDPAEYHFALARIAEQRKQWDLAEGQLRRAVELAPKQVGRIVDLARFLARRGKHHESDSAFQLAAKVDPANKAVIFARAETYIASGRNVDDARKLLQQYLQLPLGPDDPSREEARRLLRKAGG